MNNITLVRQQFRLWALVLIAGTALMFTILGWFSYSERANRRLLYDYHLVSETYARAMYAAYSRATRPLGLDKLTLGDIVDPQAYASNTLLEYEQILSYGNAILALDGEFANPETANVMIRMRSALSDIEFVWISSAPDRLGAAIALSNSDLDIGLLSEQLFRIHRAAFLRERQDLEQQESVNTYVLAVLMAIVSGIIVLLWYRTFRIISRALLREQRARRASTNAQQELRNYQEELEQLIEERTLDIKHARDNAERASSAKSQFLSRMSHELRTPLNVILGFGQLLTSDPKQALGEQQAGYVREMVYAGQHLLDMVNDVLDLAQVERGILPLQLQSVEVAPLIEECVAQIQPMAEQRGISTSLNLKYSAPVSADPVRFKQVLLNLLSNAVKYNSQGGEIHIHARPGQANRLRISVRDTGAGIPPESMNRLFRSFDRIGTVEADIQGTGIGLALSKQLVTTMKGEIGAVSEPGAGSTFWFELPGIGITNGV